MKIFKTLQGIFLCACVAGIFSLWAYEGFFSFFDPIKSVQFYPALRGTAQLAVITAPSLQDGPDYYLGVRASQSERWRQFLLVFGESIDKPNLVWSNDGSIVSLTDKQGIFSAAYDFRLKHFYQASSDQDSKSTSRQISQALRKRGGSNSKNNPSRSRDLGLWRWQDANLKQLLRNWKN